jgi:hypothetical protein
LTVLGLRQRCLNRATRWEVLPYRASRAGAQSLLSLARANSTSSGDLTKSVIRLVLAGGPEQSDILAKTDAPANCRTRFQRFDTSVPRLQAREQLRPMTGKFVNLHGVRALSDAWEWRRSDTREISFQSC